MTPPESPDGPAAVSGAQRTAAKRRRSLSRTCGALLAGLLVFSLAGGGVPRARAEGSPARGLVQTADWDSVGSFFDGTIERQLADHHVAGAVVALVKDGEILFTSGYGEANIAEHVPVSPDRTLFRIASTTKLFTWTAVMQLVEQGLLDLDVDVNAYLDFEIPATYPEPITLRHLMSHAAGFEERTLGIFVPTLAHLVPAAEWLPANLPARVRPPGTASSYSNYGAALAGYIVARAAGMDYEAYVETNILQPLGMARTTARQPLPPNLAGDLALGYAYLDGAYVAQPFDVLQTVPASSMSATATDMAAFVIAHLQDGRYGSRRILAEATAQQMHSTLFRHDARLRSGYAYGFEEREWNGQTVLSHGGDFQYFHSRVDLVPAQGVGLFVAYNGAMAENLPEQLLRAFLDWAYPVDSEATGAAGTAPADFAARAAPLAGVYQSNRHAYTTPDKLLLLVQPALAVRVDGHTLVASGPYVDGEQRYAEVAPLLFQRVDGRDRLAFRMDETGRADLAFLESQPTIAFERLAWYETALFNQALLGAILLLFLSAPAAGAVRLVRRPRGRSAADQPVLARVARWTVGIAAVASWLFLVLTGVATVRLIGSLGADSGALGVLSGLALVPPVIALLGIAGAVLLVPVWRQRYWRPAGRVHYTLLVVACVAFVWFLAFWRLLAF